MSAGLSVASTMAARSDIGWYGLQPWWQMLMEAAARREHGRDLRVHLEVDLLVYGVPIEVPGRLDPVPVSVFFFARPPYPCWGLPPEEYPRVIADPDSTSPHRMPGDNALCLYYPLSPPGERWQPKDGLLALIDLTRDHLFFEDHWWATGGKRGGQWLGEEQPHGFPGEAA
ncbi:hypothetical protein [Modestobacter lacusdianchii]